MFRKGFKPGLRFGLNVPRGNYRYSKVLPFRRSWIAIGLLAVMDAVFLIPLFLTFRQASFGWGSFDSLFDLVTTLFLSAWMLGWSLAPILMTIVLLLMLFGREVIRVRPGAVELSFGVAGLGLAATYDVSGMRNLRAETPEKKSGHSWRGRHMVFDYGANTVRFGSAIDHPEQAELVAGIESAAGTSIASGPARPEDLEDVWEPAATESRSLAAPVLERELADQSPSWASPTSLALIVANLVPIGGAIFLDWSLSDVMVLYWAESAVIGFFNFLKIIVIGRWGALFYGPFFLGHFGGFMSVHFLFIYTLFVQGIDGDIQTGSDLAEVGRLFIALWPALAALFISHAYSFFANFVGREEYRGRSMQAQMTEPYSRIVFMHLVLIFGGALALFLQDAWPVLVIVILIKIALDLRSHIRERRPESAGKRRK